MIKLIATIIAVAVTLLWALHAYNNWSRPAVGVPTVATEAPALKGAPVEEIIVKAPIKVRSGEAVKRKLRLTEPNIVNPEIVVVAASELKPDTHPVDVISTLNKETGAIETVVVRKELPWLDLKSSGRVWGGPGLQNGQPAVQVGVIQDFIAVKGIVLSGIAHATQVTGGSDIHNPIPLTTFVGVTIGTTW